MNDQIQLIEAIDRLTSVLTEIKDWLLTKKIESPPSPVSSNVQSNDELQARINAGRLSCPLCNASMVARKRRNDGSWFCGCERYPECKGTRNSDGTPTGSKKPVTAKPAPVQDDEPEDEDVPF